MSSLETVRSLADLASELARIPDDTPLDWETAAMMINPRKPKSRKTMYRWRYTGRGPRFSKGEGKNADVSYLAGDVRDWIKSNRVTTTVGARLRRVLRLDSLQSLTTNHPWIARNGAIVGHALTVPESELRGALEGLDGFQVVIASVEEALTQHRWTDPAARAPFRAALTDMFASRVRDCEARAAETEETSLGVNVPKPNEGRCPKCGHTEHPGVPCRRL